MPYADPTAHKQCRVLLPAEDFEAVSLLAAAEERSISYVAGRLIREALAARDNRPITPLTENPRDRFTCPMPRGTSLSRGKIIGLGW